MEGVWKCKVPRSGLRTNLGALETLGFLDAIWSKLSHTSLILWLIFNKHFGLRMNSKPVTDFQTCHFKIQGGCSHDLSSQEKKVGICWLDKNGPEGSSLSLVFCLVSKIAGIIDHMVSQYLPFSLYWSGNFETPSEKKGEKNQEILFSWHAWNSGIILWHHHASVHQ